MRFNVPVLALEGKSTDDGRTFGRLDWRDPPLTLYAQLENTPGHDGAGIAGSLDEISKGDDGTLTAVIDTDDDGFVGREAARLIMREDLRGISVDVAIDESTVEPVIGDDGDMVGVNFGEATVIAATLTGMPAFGEANQIDPQPLDGDDAPEEPDVDTDTEDGGALAAAEVTGQVDLPVAPRDTDWDGTQAASNVFDLCSDGDDVDVACVSRAFLWRDPDEDGTAQAHWSLGFADVIDGQLQIVPAGVFATAGGRGLPAVEGIPAEEQARIETRICSLYDRINEALDEDFDCPFADEDDTDGGDGDGAAIDVAPAAVSASAGDVMYVGPSAEAVAASASAADPPASWFQDPQLDGPTPLTVDDDGRLYGHVATWGTCHIGWEGVCVDPPVSESGYAYFATGELKCPDGCQVPVGQVTMDTDHPDTRGVTRREAERHYADTGLVVADIAVGEDEHGIWAAGAVRPSVMEDAERLRALRACGLSGDWRRIGGNLELIAVLAVNTPGFPVARVASGRQQALVAAGAVPPQTFADGVGSVDIEGTVRRVVEDALANVGLTAVDAADDLAGQLAALDADVREAAVERLDADVAPSRERVLDRLDEVVG